jgi:hypothetical protein
MNQNAENPKATSLSAPQVQPLTAEQNTQSWRLMPPQVPRELTTLPPLLRAAEVLRFSILRFEHWLSSTGRLRRFLRAVLVICCCLAAISFWMAPFITSILTQLTVWSAMAAELVNNLTSLPFGIGKFLLGFAAIAVALRLVFRR